MTFNLVDDGTLDTVIECYCSDCDQTWEERICMEYAADYRDEDTGEMLDFDGLTEDLGIFCLECAFCEE